jgi:prostaglandin-endoperoxide synthase 2
LMNTLFLREHNRVAGLLERQYPGWDDERLFQTARNVLILLLIKIVIEEYINHITPYFFQVGVDPAAFKNERWFRPNWMAIEFNLLYRWHGLIPPTLHGEPVWKTIFNPALVVERGVGPLIDDASRHRANRVGVFNTDPALRQVELASIREARAVQLAPYNDYRELASFPRVTDFDQITGDEATQSALKDLYGHVDRIEFFPGLFAEDARPNSVLPSLIGRMVGVDAFSQALTNPLLSPRVFNEHTFSPVGMEIIGGTLPGCRWRRRACSTARAASASWPRVWCVPATRPTPPTSRPTWSGAPARWVSTPGCAVGRRCRRPATSTRSCASATPSATRVTGAPRCRRWRASCAPARR